jgi:hypothetical protein
VTSIGKTSKCLYIKVIYKFTLYESEKKTHKVISNDVLSSVDDERYLPNIIPGHGKRY